MKLEDVKRHKTAVVLRFSTDAVNCPALYEIKCKSLSGAIAFSEWAEGVMCQEVDEAVRKNDMDRALDDIRKALNTLEMHT